MLRRASRSVLPLAIRAAGAPRVFHGAISAVANPKKHSIAPNLNRNSSLFFSTLVNPSSDQQILQEPHTDTENASEVFDEDTNLEETAPEGFPFRFHAITMVRELDDETIKLVVDIPPCDPDDTPLTIPVYTMTVTISKGIKTSLEFGATIVPDKFSVQYSDVRDPDGPPDVGWEWPDFGYNKVEKMKYLEDRGITLDFTNYLYNYITTHIRKRRDGLRD